MENTGIPDSLLFDDEQWKQYYNYTTKYTPPNTGSYDSFLDEGGFVFTFDTSEQKILKLS